MTKRHELYDLAYERALLASICQSGLDVFIDVDYVTSDTFTDPVNQIVFDVAKKCILEGSEVDLSTILSKVTSLGLGKIFEKKDDLEYLRSLFNFPFNKNNVQNYAAKLTRLKLLRDAKREFESAISDISKLTGEEDVGDILSIIEAPGNKLSQSIYNSDNSKPIELGTTMYDYVVELLNNPQGFAGLPSGFLEYDRAIGGGLRNGCVDVVAARPKTGKSTFGLQVAMHQSANGIPVLIIDTEMDSNSQKNRLLANVSGVSVNDISQGNKSYAQKLLKHAENLKNSNIDHINVSGRSFDSILSIMRQWVYRKVGFDSDGNAKPCLIIYDYLKLTSGDNITESMKEYQILGFQMTNLHNFMVKYKVPCLAFVQLNKEDDIAQSDRILWLCTSYTKFKEKSQQEQADDIAAGIPVPFNRKLEPQVARYGPAMDFGDYINLRMEGEYSRLTAGPTRNQLLRGNNVNVNIPDISQAGADTQEIFDTRSDTEDT